MAKTKQDFLDGIQEFINLFTKNAKQRTTLLNKINGDVELAFLDEGQIKFTSTAKKASIKDLKLTTQKVFQWVSGVKPKNEVVVGFYNSNKALCKEFCHEKFLVALDESSDRKSTTKATKKAPTKSPTKETKKDTTVTKKAPTTKKATKASPTTKKATKASPKISTTTKETEDYLKVLKKAKVEDIAELCKVYIDEFSLKTNNIKEIKLIDEKKYTVYLGNVGKFEKNLDELVKKRVINISLAKEILSDITLHYNITKSIKTYKDLIGKIKGLEKYLASGVIRMFIIILINKLNLKEKKDQDKLLVIHEVFKLQNVVKTFMEMSPEIDFEKEETIDSQIVYTLTSDNIQFIFNKESFSISFRDKRFKEIKNLVENYSGTDEENKRLNSLLGTIQDKVNKQKLILSDPNIKVVDNQIIYGDLILKNTIVFDYINAIESGGLQIKSLQRFIKNLDNVENEDSKKDLYDFIKANNFPITNMGTILVYRWVTYGYKDGHTGSVDNSVGNIVSMNPNDVDKRKTQSCSTGLHVCSSSYGRFAGANSRLIMSEVHPEHFITVPKEYKMNKVRCSAYNLVQEVSDSCLNNKVIEEQKLVSTLPETILDMTNGNIIKLSDIPHKVIKEEIREEIKNFIINVVSDIKNKEKIIKNAKFSKNIVFSDFVSHMGIDEYKILYLYAKKKKININKLDGEIFTLADKISVEEIKEILLDYFDKNYIPYSCLGDLHSYHTNKKYREKFGTESFNLSGMIYMSGKPLSFKKECYDNLGKNNFIKLLKAN